MTNICGKVYVGGGGMGWIALIYGYQSLLSAILWLTKLIVGESDSYNVIGVYVMEKPTGEGGGYYISLLCQFINDHWAWVVWDDDM